MQRLAQTRPLPIREGVYIKMKKRKLNKYKKEYVALIEKHGRVLHHHTSQVFLRLVNDFNKLNAEYYDLKDDIPVQEKKK